MRRALLRSSICYALANGAFSGLPLLLLPVLVQGLGQVGFGHWVAFSVVVSTVLALGGLGANGFVILEWPKSNEAPNRAGLLVGAALAGMTGLAIATPFVAAYLWLYPATPEVDATWAVVAVLLAGLNLLVLVALSVWQSEGQALKYLWIRLGHAVALAGCTLLIVRPSSARWEDLALAYVAVACVFAAIAWGSLRNQFSEGAVNVPAHFSRAMWFGLALLPHSLGGVAIAAADKLLVGTLLGTAQLGAYAIVSQICFLLALITDSANRSYAPWLFRFLAARNEEDPIRARRLVRQTYIAMTSLMIGAAGFGAIVDVLLSRYGGVSYDLAAGCALPISLGHGLTGCYYLVVNYVMYRQRVLILAAVTISAGLVSIALGVALIPRLGVIGAAWAFAASQGVLFLGAWILAMRLIPMPWFTRRSAPL